MDYDFIVIGAGAAGLSFTALMEKKGYKVALLEAHMLPGGCASYFERNGNVYDAGATTLSGLKPGRSIDLLMKELSLDLTIMKVDPGLVALSNGKKVSRYSDHSRWLRELEAHFPDIDHGEFWGLVKEVDDRGWEITSTLKNIPFRAPGDILKLNFKKALLSMKLLPYFFKGTSSYLPSISDPGYRAILDEILFITAQNNLEQTPMLMGAMGLNYPADTAYVMGGMKAFVESLAHKCSHLFYKHQVLSIEPLSSGKEGFRVHTNQGDFKAKKVVSTLPVWNHEKLFAKGTMTNEFFADKDDMVKECWSAFSIYLTIPTDRERESLYYQIHCDPIPNCGTRSFFVSLSHPDDHSRSSKPGRQTVTISTHAKPDEWFSLPKDEYKIKKAQTTNFIIKELSRHFHLQAGDVTDVLSGSPTTFMKYTKRSKGLVGGIPHSLKRNPFKLVFNFSPIENFYLIGDTQFPGQGIAAVVLGAQNLCGHFPRKN